jgi:hypothetical protein
VHTRRWGKIQDNRFTTEKPRPIVLISDEMGIPEINIPGHFLPHKGQIGETNIEK